MVIVEPWNILGKIVKTTNGVPVDTSILLTGFFKPNVPYPLYARHKILPQLKQKFLDCRFNLYPNTEIDGNSKRLESFFEIVPCNLAAKRYGWLWVKYIFSSSSIYNFDKRFEALMNRMGYISTIEIFDSKLECRVDSFSRWSVCLLREELENGYFPEKSKVIDQSPIPDRFL